MEYGSEESGSGIERGEPEVNEARKALVTELLAEVTEDKKKWGPSFTRMREDMKFVRKQLPSETDDDERAKANIIQRHIKQRVASLYARNPTFVAKRRPRLDFAVWDGTRMSLEKAAAEMDMAAQAGMQPSPETMALLKDVQQGITHRRMLDKVGRTLEVLLSHTLDEQQPPFKSQCKQLVRRSVICTVGYVKVMFQRQLEKRPDVEARLADVTAQLANYERMSADAADGETDANSAEIERLRLVQRELQAQTEIVVREGLVYDFTSPLRVIPDRETTQLTAGFPGARRVSEEFLLTCDEIKETYGVDIGANYTGYKELSTGQVRKSETDGKKALVYEVYDKKDGLLYVLCEGYPDFLKEPGPPPLPYLETFFPWLPLVFNPLEEECEIYPESDVRLLRPLQREINRKAEAIRQHRIASRPLYLARSGALEEEDAKSLAGHEAHEVVQLQGLDGAMDLSKAFAAFPKVGVDPNLYETGTDLALVQLVAGQQEANLGGTAGDSATENSIAEASRMEAVSSETDELDDFLSMLARLSGQVLLNEMSAETVQRVVGPGAVWPSLRAQEIAEEVFLEIEAGSSGRPNKERDLAAFERAAPTLLQTPGIDPEWFAKYQIRLLDSGIDYEEAITAGLPSITSMNRQSQVGTGDPATDPAQQGGEGGDNAPNDDASTGGAQPAFPAPAAAQPNVPVA